jgi:exodeoxyribonuclease VII small subunit
MMNAQNEPMTFEQALTRLEEIVRILEVGERPLEETVNLYEEGQRLRQYCEQYLADAEQRITIIRQASGNSVIVEEVQDADDEPVSFGMDDSYDAYDDPFR